MSTTLPNIHYARSAAGGGAAPPHSTLPAGYSSNKQQYHHQQQQPNPSPSPPSSSSQSAGGYPRRRVGGTNSYVDGDEKEQNSNSGGGLVPAPPSSGRTAGFISSSPPGSYTSSRFTLDSSIDPHLFAAVRNYLPFLLYHAHPNAKDVEITEAGVLQLFDTVGAHYASLYPPSASISSAHVQSLTAKQTLARIQELSMTGTHFSSMDQLVGGLRNFLLQQSAINSSNVNNTQQQQAGEQQQQLLGFSSANVSGSLSGSSSSRLGMNVGPTPAHAAGWSALDDADYRRLKFNAHQAVQERVAEAHQQGVESNPYLREATRTQLLTAHSQQSAGPYSASAALDSLTASSVWSEAALQGEKDIQSIYNFLRGNACRLWTDPYNPALVGGTTFERSSAASGHGGGLEDFTLLEVSSMVNSLGGASEAPAILQMLRELSEANCVSFASLQEMAGKFTESFQEKISRDVLIYLIYPKESGLLLPPTAAAASSSNSTNKSGGNTGSNNSGTAAMDLSQVLTQHDILKLMEATGGGVWTLIHLHTLQAAGKQYAAFSELARALRALEGERSRKLEELHRFLNDSLVVRELFVPPPRILKPSERVGQYGAAAGQGGIGGSTIHHSQQPVNLSQNVYAAESEIPIITLAHVSQLMYSSRGGNNTIHYVKVLVESLHSSSVQSAPGSVASKRRFENMDEFSSVVREMVIKEALYQTLSKSSLFVRPNGVPLSQPNPAISVEGVNSFYRFLLGSSSTGSLGGAAGFSFLHPGWELIELLKGLDRIGISSASSSSSAAAVQSTNSFLHPAYAALQQQQQQQPQKKLHDLAELVEFLVGTQETNSSSSSSAPASAGVNRGGVSSRPTSGMLISHHNVGPSTNHTPSPPLLARYMLAQFQERKQLFLNLLNGVPSSSSSATASASSSSTPLSIVQPGSGLILHPVYTGPRLTASQVDQLYESTGLGIKDTSYAMAHPSSWVSGAFLLPVITHMQSLGHSFSTLSALAHAVRYRMECELVREYLRSEDCALLPVKNAHRSWKAHQQQQLSLRGKNGQALLTSGDSSIHQAASSSLPSDDNNRSKALNLSYGDIDLLFAEILDREVDLHLLLHILRQLNEGFGSNTGLAARQQQADTDEDYNSSSIQPQQKTNYLFFNLQQLVVAVRQEYALLVLERNEVFSFLTSDAGGRSLLTASSSSSSSSSSHDESIMDHVTPSSLSPPLTTRVRLSRYEVIDLIRLGGATPHTPRLLRQLLSAHRVGFHSIHSLADALYDQSQRENQERWKILMYLTNGNQQQQEGEVTATPSSSSSSASTQPSKPHGLFRHAYVPNMMGRRSTIAPLPGTPSFLITPAGVDRLFLISRFRTLKFLRALDLTQASFMDMYGVESALKHMEMKNRVLTYLNSPACTLFVRPGSVQHQQQGGRSQALVLSGYGGGVGAVQQTAVSTSIPSHFTGREIERIWMEAQSGLSTLTYIKLLESRIGEHASHISPSQVLPESASNSNSSSPLHSLRVSKGQYTAFQDLVEDLYALHQDSLKHRKQILTYLLQSSSEVSSASEHHGSSSSSTSLFSSGASDASGAAAAGGVSATAFGAHHFFRQMDYPFHITPQHVDQLFEGGLFDYEESVPTGSSSTDSSSSPASSSSSDSSSIFFSSSPSV